MTTTRPPIPSPRPAVPPPTAVKKTVQFHTPNVLAGTRVVLYGTGGIGKTTLAANMPGRSVFFDLDESLGKLKLDFPCVPCDTWEELMAALNADGWDEVDNIHMDTFTKAGELCVDSTLRLTRQDGKAYDSLEAYGFGKGYTYVYEKFLTLLAALDRHVRAGRNVVLICHDCVSDVPNPGGENWMRYEPRLQDQKSGKASIRARVKEWADQVLFIGYDVESTKKGKGTGSGTRTLYPKELPFCMAKSRTIRAPMEVTENNAAQIWAAVLDKEME